MAPNKKHEHCDQISNVIITALSHSLEKGGNKPSLGPPPGPSSGSNSFLLQEGINTLHIFPLTPNCKENSTLISCNRVFISHSSQQVALLFFEMVWKRP